jgi:hypothetical protein
MNPVLKSLALAFAVLLGACSTMEQRLPDDTILRIDTVRSLDHAHSLATRWKPTGEKKADGTPVMEEVKLDKFVGLRPDGSPIVVQERVGEKISGPSVVGQMAVAAVGGPLTAATNGYFGKEIAKIGSRCNGGGCGTTIVNNVQSVAEAINQNKVKIGVNAGVAPACAASNACGN